MRLARRGGRGYRGGGWGRPLTQDATRSRVWGRRAKLTGSRAAPARPAPNEPPSMASLGGPRAPGALCPPVRRAGPTRGRPGLLRVLMLPVRPVLLPPPPPPFGSARPLRRGCAGRHRARATAPPPGPRAQGWRPHLPPPRPLSTPGWHRRTTPPARRPLYPPVPTRRQGQGAECPHPKNSPESAGPADTGLSLCGSHTDRRTVVTLLL